MWHDRKSKVHAGMYAAEGERETKIEKFENQSGWSRDNSRGVKECWTKAQKAIYTSVPALLVVAPVRVGQGPNPADGLYPLSAIFSWSVCVQDCMHEWKASGGLRSPVTLRTAERSLSLY